ncbi:uncharacterized protein LOC116384286 [Anarrhichthys ocellatus]|uniref:uncharacterized protein LOC116384286 n=1 Tax=Anarrhichthys ocellatus TaxID=433405 RepID=UPI0012ECE14F|nr:uncharacterized protein LOC116384286 [Anarrhichthys ocellatus]
MNRHRDIKLHISIHKGLSTPPLQKCKNCCHPAKFHCPFCLPSSFEPTNYSRARHHLDKHLKKSIHLQGYTIHRCRLECRNQPHYHCLYCPATRIRKQDLNKHVLRCLQDLQERDPQSSQLHTKGSTSPAKDDILSCDIESCDDGDDLTVITDRDHQHSRGASGSQRVTPVVVQTVQTNSEKPQDCDEFYFMNLVKMFKKLSPQKKAEVRMKIERLLFEAEFD